MANAIFGWPLYEQPSVLYTPSVDSGSWNPLLPGANVLDRRVSKVARSNSAALADTRLRVDLGTDRQVRLCAMVGHNLSSAAKVRYLGVPSTLLFDYEAGDDIAAKGGTFTRAPTAGARAATYVDAAGVVRFAGENRCLYSQALDTGASWVATTCTVAADALAAPDGTTTAESLTATAGNATLIQDLGVVASQTWTFSIWLKRKTGTGNVQLTLDGGASWTTKAVTSDWTRFSIGQTLANPDVGIRIVTNADAVYAWGAQTELGSAMGSYLPTTNAAVGAPRDAHFPTIGGDRTILLEEARTNLVIRSDELATGWTVSVGAATNAFLVQAGIFFSRLSGGPNLDCHRTVTLTGDGTKAMSIILHAYGSSTGTYIFSLYDGTAVTARCRVTVTVAPGGTMTAVATIGTLLKIIPLADQCYRFLVQAPGCIAANTNYAYAAEASTVTDMLVAGVQVEDATFPSSYLPTTTTTVARAADTGPTFTPPTSDGTIYQKYFDSATQAWVESTASYTGSTALTFTTHTAYTAMRVATGTKTQAQMQAAVYDSGWVTPWPAGATAEDLAGLNWPAVVVVPTTAVAARYWSIQVNDSANADTYVEMGRLLFAAGWQPSINMSYGAKVGLETDTVRTVVDGGGALYDEKPIRRTAAFAIEHLPEAEAFASAWKLARQAGTSKQVFFVYNPDDTTILHERSFLAVLRELTALENPWLAHYSTAWGLVEEL